MTLACALDISVRSGSFNFRYRSALIVWATPTIILKERSDQTASSPHGDPRCHFLGAEWLGHTLTGRPEPLVNRVAQVHVPVEPEVRFISEPETAEDALRTTAPSSLACSCPLVSASDELVSCIDGGAGLCAGSCSVRSFSVRDFEPGDLQTSPGYPGRTTPPVGGYPLSGPSEFYPCSFSCEITCHLGIN